MPRPMPRFQFSLRALLVAIAIACAPCAWIANAAIIVRQRNAIRPEFLWAKSSLLVYANVGKSRESHFPWLRRALGDEPIEFLIYTAARDPDGSELRRARLLFPEADILEAGILD